MSHFLGADIGTTNVKAVLVDDRQRVVASASRTLPLMRPKRGWAEQDPESWWKAFAWVCASLHRQAPAECADVAALGLAGQMHAAVCLDGRDRPLRPAILWNDGRAQAECIELQQAVPELRGIAGVIAMSGFTAPKLLWLRHHERCLFDRIEHVLFPKDFVRLKLSGRHLTDMSDAAGSLWLDESKRDWSPRLLAASGMASRYMPSLQEGSHAAGMLEGSMAKKLGFRAPVVLAAGGGDVAVGAVGIGAIDEEDCFISLGTSGQYFIARERYALTAEPTVHSFAHCLPSRWYDMAALLNGANCLEWICRLLHVEAIPALAELERRLDRPSPVLFLPYLAGERTPHNDPDLRATFLGLDHSTERHHLVQSVLEGVALSLADAEMRLARRASLSAPMAVVGGATFSTAWMQILADVLGRDLVLYDTAASAAPMGAARLARLALAHEPLKTVCIKPPSRTRIRPRPAWHDSYRASLERFQRSFAELAGLTRVPR